MKSSVYSEQFKKNAVKKHLNSGLSYPKMSEKLGLSQSTLFSWVQKYANQSGMADALKKSIKDWTTTEKLEAIMKTASMSKNDLGKFLRSNGLHSSDLDSFKTDYTEHSLTKGRPKLDPEIVTLRKEKKLLEKEIRRKDKALAEFSARIILLKKSHEIWGVQEDEE